MSIQKLLVGAAFAVAIGVTAFFTSMAASSAFAGAGNFAVERPIPGYLLNWDNPLLPMAPVAPIVGH